MVWSTYDKIPPEPIRGTFDLTPSHLQKLRESAASKLKNKGSRLSSFALASSCAWTLLAKTEHTREKTAVLIIAVDCRSRLEPPIPPTYLGNCIAGSVASAETKNLLGNDGFVSALEAISEALDRSEEEGVLGKGSRSIGDTIDPSQQRVFSIAGSPRFGVYSVDFGWGRPKKVEMTSIDKTEAFCLAESKHGNGGIEIGLVRSKPLMECFAALLAEGLESL
ncbi:hypothetical protein L6164_007556 [Bauhinia variegata]|uniref:Uncharacterized protein n=1 Tax=Bauhinia variegata TaxID=167791 RepID=A0ACB9PE12_BAUVA|nr:hypothetical protein L6164_007556 [Bauhinia variegata]